MALRKIKGSNRLLASYWGYKSSGEYANIQKRFPDTRIGKADAEAWLVANSANKTAPPKKEDDIRMRTIREAVEYFTSRSHFTIREDRGQAQDIYRLNVFLSWCEDNHLAYLMQFGQKQAEAFAVFCQKTYKRKGIEARISLAYRLFNVDIERDDAAITKNPFRKVKKSGYDPKLKLKYLTKDQISRILSTCAPRQKAILTILFESGMRADELQHLRWCDIGTHIDISSREGTEEMVGWNTKTGESGGIRITNNLRIALDFLRMRSGRGEYVLLGDRPAHETYLNKMVRRIEKKARKEFADIPHFSPHTFRKSIGMFLVERRIPLDVIQRVLRHQKIATTAGWYAHLQLKDLDPAVAILDSEPTIDLEVFPSKAA